MGSRTLTGRVSRTTSLKLSLLIGVLAMVGCRDNSPARLTAPSTASLANGADQSWLRTSLSVDYTTFVQCLGEDVHLFGEVPIQVHFVTNASGGFNGHRLFLPLTPNAPLFHVQVISTGKDYIAVNGHPINETVHIAAGEVYSFREIDVFRAADGSELFFTAVLHGTVNANGVPTASRFVFEDVNCG